jgi:uncharacterized RDD family membrane protein YckC
MDSKPFQKIQFASVSPLTLIEPPASLVQRTLACSLDIILAFALIWMLLERFILPLYDASLFLEFKQILYAHQQELSQSAHAFNLRNLPPFPLTVQKLILYAQGMVLLMLWLYFAGVDIFLQGRSVGKRVFQLKVVNLWTFKEPTLLEYASRSMVKAFCCTVAFPVLLIVNCLSLFFNKQSRMGHDLIARTIVVEDNIKEVVDVVN